MFERCEILFYAEAGALPKKVYDIVALSKMTHQAQPLISPVGTRPKLSGCEHRGSISSIDFQLYCLSFDWFASNSQYTVNFKRMKNLNSFPQGLYRSHTELKENTPTETKFLRMCLFVFNLINLIFVWLLPAE